LGTLAARVGECENLFVQSPSISDDERIYRLPKRRGLYTMDCLGKPMNHRLQKTVPVLCGDISRP